MRQPSHDAAWKQFFALPAAVEHLLAGFFPEVAARLDFTTLRDVSGEWVEDGARRRGDAVWRVRYRDGTDRSLVLFLEFQSTVDAAMPRRVLRNLGMAYERARRADALDGDGRLRPLCVVLHAGRRRWTAPGAADRVEVAPNGEVLATLAQPYAALDARRHPREHLPPRNLVATLFALCRVAAVGDAAAPLARLGGWLPGLANAAAVRAAFAEWLSTTMPTVFPAEDAAALVERLTNMRTEEEPMAYTVLEDKLRRQMRRIDREGEARGRELGLQQGLVAYRELLASQVTRRFGPDTAARVAGQLAGIADVDGLERVGGWIVVRRGADRAFRRWGARGSGGPEVAESEGGGIVQNARVSCAHAALAVVSYAGSQWPLQACRWKRSVPVRPVLALDNLELSALTPLRGRHYACFEEGRARR